MESQTRAALMSGWLGQIDRSVAELILQAGRLSKFSDGAEIYGLGQPQDCLHGVARGTVKMLVAVNEQDPKFGHLAGPGFWFGETAAVTGNQSLVELTASGPTETLSISRKQIDAIAQTHAGVWPAITLLAVCNLGTAIAVGEDLLIRDSRKRMVATLLRLSARRSCFQNIPPFASIPVSWNELAEATNLSRSKVGALLSELSKQGLVETRQKQVRVVDAIGLDELLKQ